MHRRTTEIFPTELEKRIQRVLQVFNKKWTAWSREAFEFHVERYEKYIIEETK